MTAIYCGLALLCFVLGVAIGSIERADRRIERQQPITITPSLRQLRMWRSDRR